MFKKASSVLPAYKLYVPLPCSRICLDNPENLLTYHHQQPPESLRLINQTYDAY